MLLETGCANKQPIIDENKTKIICNNQAQTEKKEQYIHLGKGTCVLANVNVVA